MAPRIRDFSVELYRGQSLGLLGNNGAGKSTALALLAGALQAEQGELTVAHDSVGWLPQHNPLYPDMRVTEQLRFQAGLRACDPHAVTEAIERFDLGKLQRRLCGQLSGGEQRRVALACALLHQPRILLLDEPSNGLDAKQAERLRAFIQQLRTDHALLIASHQTEDIQGLCDAVCLMQDGRLLSNTRLTSLEHYRLARFIRPPSDEALSKIPGVQHILTRSEAGILLELNAQAPADMAEVLATQGWGLSAWETPTLHQLSRQAEQSALTAAQPKDQP